MDTLPLGSMLLPAAVEIARQGRFGTDAANPDWQKATEDIQLAYNLSIALSSTNVQALTQLGENMRRQGRRPTALERDPAGNLVAKPQDRDFTLDELAIWQLPSNLRVALGSLWREGRQAWQTRLNEIRARQAAHQASVDLLNQQQAAARSELWTALKGGKLVSFRWNHETGEAEKVLPPTFWQSERAAAAMAGERIFEPLGGIPGPLGHHFSAIIRRDDLNATFPPPQPPTAVDVQENKRGAPPFDTLEAWVAKPQAQQAAYDWAQAHGRPWRVKRDVAAAMHEVLKEQTHTRKEASIERALRGLTISPPLEQPEKVPVENRKKQPPDRK